jgi:hypothetical protein
MLNAMMISITDVENIPHGVKVLSLESPRSLARVKTWGFLKLSPRIMTTHQDSLKNLMKHGQESVMLDPIVGHAQSSSVTGLGICLRSAVPSPGSEP